MSYTGQTSTSGRRNLEETRISYTENALSAGCISEQSRVVLRRAGLLDRFDEDPDLVLTELHRGVGAVGEDDRLFVLAELSYLHAERTGDRAYFMAAAVYAYALLFPGAGASTPLQASDARAFLPWEGGTALRYVSGESSGGASRAR